VIRPAGFVEQHGHHSPLDTDALSNVTNVTKVNSSQFLSITRAVKGGNLRLATDHGAVICVYRASSVKHQQKEETNE
jgi:hypothetical protein